MASAILTPPTSSLCVSSLCTSLSSSTRSRTVGGFSSSAISAPLPSSNLKFFKWVPQLGLCQFAEWSGLKILPTLTSQHLVKLKLERKGQCKRKGAHASLFGVGAPEALVIGVVALLVFGPKGLAEVARNLGKTLRAFQPTIRELQEVSREFKSTLEKEIGIDDLQNPNWNASTSTKTTSSPPLDAGSKASQLEIDPNGLTTPNEAYSSEELLKITEEQLKAASVKQQEETTSPVDNQSRNESLAAQPQTDESPRDTQADIQTQPQVVSESSSVTPLPGKPARDT